METLIIIGLIAFFAVVGILRRVIVRKGGDAIDNAIKRRMNEKKGDTTENLSDRYKSEAVL